MRAIFAIGLLCLTSVTQAQDIHHHKGMTPEVDRFYSTWLQPNYGNPRYYGCCNRTDCYPTEAKNTGGMWWFRHRESAQWIPVPDYKVEHYQSDPRESPDGRNHVCASTTGIIYCFVVGSQI